MAFFWLQGICCWIWVHTQNFILKDMADPCPQKSILEKYKTSALVNNCEEETILKLLKFIEETLDGDYY